MENESSHDPEDLSQILGGLESSRSALPTHRYHQLYVHHEVEIAPDICSNIVIPSKPSSPFQSKFSLPTPTNQGKEHEKNSNKSSLQPFASLPSSPEERKPTEEFASSRHPKFLEKKVSIEVVLTEEHLKELMKCKPTNEWISRTGKQLKYSFPELAKAASQDNALKKKQQQLTSKQHSLEPLPVDIQFNTICNWKGLQTQDKMQILYLKLLKYILLRESSLQRLTSILDAVELWYWKYSYLVMDRIQFGKSIVTEELNQMIRIIHSKQQELSVALAHHRTLSINVVEATNSWRKECARSTVMPGVPSIYYQDNNYLLKMMTDLSSLLCSKQTMKMWLGFEPNNFLVPPVPHDPKQIRLRLENKRRVWIKERQQWINNQLAHLQSLSQQQHPLNSSSTVNPGNQRRHTMMQQGHGHGQGQRQGGQGQGSQQGQNLHDISTSTSSNSPSLSPSNDRLLRATRSSPIVLQGGVANTSQSSTPYSPSQDSPPFASAAAPPVPQVMLTVSRRMSQSFSSVPSADLSSARSLTPNSHRSMPMVTSNSATQLMTTQSPQHNQHMLPSLSAPNLSPGAAASASAGSARRAQQPFFPESHEEGNEEEEEHSDDDNDSDSDDSAKGKRKGTRKESKGKGKGMGAGEEEENGMKAYKTTHNTSNISHQSHHPQRTPSAAAVSAASTPRDEDQDHDSMSSTSFGSSSVTTQLEEEWLELRHKCEPSWGTSADPSGAIFWTNYDQNPTLVEAAIGFIDTFPEIFLVPPLSHDLASRCERCERVLEEEVLNQINRIEVKEIATQRREELESYLEELQKRQDDLYDLPLNIATAEDRERERREEEEKMFERQLNEQMALKLRQERARLRDICHPGEVITSASAVATASGAIAPVPLSARPVIHGKGYAEEDHETEAAAATAAIASGHFNIFLTSAPSPSHGEAGPEAHPEVDPHISRPVPMKINSKALEKLIATRITQQTSRLMRIGDALVLIKDRSCAPKLIHITNTATPAPTNTNTLPSSHTATTRRPPHSKKITSLQATILVQSLIRGALIRWRLRRKQRALKKMNSLFLIQKYARRFVAKLRLNQRRREFRYECLILRKAINRRHKAAVILQNFMKYAVFLVRREDYLRKYNSLCYLKLPTQQQQQTGHTQQQQQTGHTQQQQQRQTQQQQTAQGKYARYLQSAVTIQKIFRGYKQRNDFMKWSQAIRLLANTSHSRHTLRSKLKYNFHQMMAGTGTGTGGEEGARGRGGTSSHRTLHYTVAGSGGFQFKFRKKEVNLMRLPSSTSSVGMGGTSFQEEQGQGQGQCQEDGDKKERKHQHSSSSSTSSPSLLNLILKESDHFQTLLVRENAGIEMIHVQEEEGAGAGQGKGNEETTGAGGIGGGAGAGGRDPHGRRVSSGIPMPMPLIPQFSEEKPSARRSCDDDISLGTTPSSSARQRDLEETQRSSALPELETIPATPGTAGTGTETGTGPERPRSKKIRRALSRQNTFGTSVINTKTLKKLVSNGERSFVPDTNSPAAVSAAVMAASSSSPSLPDPNGSRRRRSSAAAGAAGGLGGSGSALAVGSVIKLKSTNDAYVNPSVHQRSVFRKQRDPGQASLQENSNNIKHLLQSLYE